MKGHTLLTGIYLTALLAMLSISSYAQTVGVSQQSFTPTSLLHVHNTAAGQLFQLSNANTSGGNTPTVNSGFNIGIDASKNITFNQYEDANIQFTINAGVQAAFLTDATKSLTSFGYNAGNGNNGLYNTAIGTNAFRYNSSGQMNTAIGMDANIYYATGSANTAVGMYSLEGNATPANNTGSYNTAIGFAAGSGYNTTGPLINTYQQTTGTYNTFLGFSSSANAGTYTNATAIGAYSLAGANNVLVLGSINGTNTATASANVGIGIIAPTSLLHVVDGGSGFAAGKLVTLDGNQTTTGQTLYIPSSSLTSGNLAYLYNTNTSATGPALLVENDGTGANAIQAIGGGAVNYSAIFAQTTSAADGTAIGVTTSTHTIYASLTGSKKWGYAIYGENKGTGVAGLGGVLGYASGYWGCLAYDDGAAWY
jgi:hypothetical protein